MAGQVRQYSNFLATISAEEWARLGLVEVLRVRTA